jgi:hypothetical protein
MIAIFSGIACGRRSAGPACRYETAALDTTPIAYQSRGARAITACAVRRRAFHVFTEGCPAARACAPVRPLLLVMPPDGLRCPFWSMKDKIGKAFPVRTTTCAALCQ